MFKKINTTNIAIITIILIFVTKWLSKDKPKPDDPLPVSDIDPNLFTISEDQAEDYADNFLDAFDHTSILDAGTNTDSLNSILNQINEYDLKLIYDKFGLKPYLYLGSHPEWLGGVPYDLKKWIELEIDEDHEVYQKFKVMFKKVGINLA
ncbi:hypothetical protein [Mesoflavibacter sp. SCSIO 43206]|uniref:hypothetical protein n=1 Tax=Mesoflavibacter sp. SCSIO 43206 TaxID=2779362 RepID=UPI001CA87E20|nr:hypothetical protein [Mesoflavibacter sp. SCSIO 43206]UAB75145.1 hypothetical protein INR78_12245 [Mesoflavibacter sp. SCSIO 43206]